MKKLLFAILFSPFILNAQQDPIYSQYLNNPFILNPAFAGLNNAFNGTLSYRKQWAGFDGSPATVNFNSHISLFDNMVGAGVLLTTDDLGTATNTEFSIAGSYRIHFKETTLSFGMQGGVLNFRGNYDQLKLFDQGDQAFATNENITKPTVGVGLILKSEKLLVGLSVPRLLKADVSAGGQEYELYNQHFYLLSSYIFFLNERFRIKPSVLLRGVQGAPLSTDVNFNLNIDGIYTAGVFTRNFNTYGLLVQAWFADKYRFGYVFEVPTNSSVGSKFTTHEVTMGFKLAVLRNHDRSLSNF